MKKIIKIIKETLTDYDGFAALAMFFMGLYCFYSIFIQTTIQDVLFYLAGCYACYRVLIHWYPIIQDYNKEN